MQSSGRADAARRLGCKPEDVDSVRAQRDQRARRARVRGRSAMPGWQVQTPSGGIWCNLAFECLAARVGAILLSVNSVLPVMDFLSSGTRMPSVGRLEVGQIHERLAALGLLPE